MEKVKTKVKTKAEIEKDFPIIKPEECPGALMKWIADRDEVNFGTWLEMLRAELKPVSRFMRIASANRIWLIGLSAVIAAVITVLWVHLA